MDDKPSDGNAVFNAGGLAMMIIAIIVIIYYIKTNGLPEDFCLPFG